MQTPLHIVEGGFVWGHQSCFGAHLNGHVAQGHTTFHAQRLDSISAELNDVTGAACTAGFADNRQHDIFRGDTRRGFPLHFNLHGFGAALLQGLRRQNVFNFRGPNPERQRAKCAVGCGMGVAADDGHAWQGNPLLRPHYVDDTLIGVVQIVQLHAKLVTVLNQLLHLDTRHLARCIDVFGLGGNVVIHRGKGFTRLTHRALVRAQAVKCLRRGHFMYQMTVDVQQWGFVWCFVDHVRIKQLLI